MWLPGDARLTSLCRKVEPARGSILINLVAKASRGLHRHSRHAEQLKVLRLRSGLQSVLCCQPFKERAADVEGGLDVFFAHVFGGMVADTTRAAQE